MNAYLMYLKMLFRLIFSQIYARVWDIDFVLFSTKSFSFGIFFFFWTPFRWKSDDGVTVSFKLKLTYILLQHALKQQTEALAEGIFQEKF